MYEASKKLDLGKIQGKLMSMSPNQLANQQNNKIANLMPIETQSTDKMTYYHNMLKLERKCEHFDKLFQKFRLKIIHKPFIILDMMKIMDGDRSSFDIFMCLYLKLRNLRKRQGFDQIIRFVEHKNELEDNWGYFAECLLRRHKRRIIKEIQAQKKEVKQAEDKDKILRRGFTFMSSVINHLARKQLRGVLAEIKKVAHQEKERMEQLEFERKKNLDIAVQQNFMLEKTEKVKESLPDPSSKNMELEVETTSNLYHMYTERHGQMNAYLESKTLVDVNQDEESEPVKENEETIEHVESSVEVKGSRLNQSQEQEQDKVKLMNEITDEIKRVKEKIKMTNSDIELELKEKIDLLTGLTRLMGLLKNYYEVVVEDSDRKNSSMDKKEFEQLLILIQRLMGKLLTRIDHDKSKRSKESFQSMNPGTENLSETEERQSLLHLDKLNNNITRELEELVAMVEPRLQDVSKSCPVSDKEDTETEEEQLQSPAGINGMLEEVMENLSKMNNTIENQQDAIIEDEGFISNFINLFYLYLFIIIFPYKSQFS